MQTELCLFLSSSLYTRHSPATPALRNRHECPQTEPNKCLGCLCAPVPETSGPETSFATEFHCRNLRDRCVGYISALTTNIYHFQVTFLLSGCISPFAAHSRKQAHCLMRLRRYWRMLNTLVSLEISKMICYWSGGF